MFEDDYKAANDALSPSGEAEQRTLASMRRSMNGADKKPRRLSVGLRTAVAACLCLLIAAPAVLGAVKLASKPSRRMQTAEQTEYSAAVPNAETAGDYSEVFEWLRPSLSDNDTVKVSGGSSRFYYDTEPVEGINSYGTATKTHIEPQSATEYSNTNVQVEGVDESDIVKTDGRYIYVLNEKGVTVLAADGAETHVVSYIPEEEMPFHDDDCGRIFSGMYLAGDRLIVIAQEFDRSSLYYRYYFENSEDTYPETTEDADGAEPESTDECYYCFHWISGNTMVYVFDIADAKKPVRISSLCMEGSFMDSRLTDGRLYVITSYFPDTEVYPDDPATFVPGCYNNDGECKLTSVGNILRIGEGGSYTYIAALNVSDPSAFTDTLALLGSTDTLYCSGTSIYLTMSNIEEKKESVRFFTNEDDGCTIDANGDHEGNLTTVYEKTGICRVSLAGGKPVLAAQGSVDGTCLNQFSLDEYDGHLRIAVTKRVSHWVEQALEDGGEICYFVDEDEVNAVYVLNSDLVTVGRLEGLA
ncbi:MAG: beta-propeller domain-containing protein, partial [Clostridia bacterium]|nr:beta-propeller domain-containing protein [Clostridia bacterium]